MTNATTSYVEDVHLLVSSPVTNMFPLITTTIIFLAWVSSFNVRKYGKSNVLTLPYDHDATSTYGTPLQFFHNDGGIPTRITLLPQISS